MASKRVLVVHDDPQERGALVHALRSAGYDVVEADTATGSEILERERFAILAGTPTLYREARAQSLTDLRTGLPNVRYLQEHLPIMIAQAARSRRPLSLVFIDSDSLKLVNDRFGHDAGDRFVKELADTIKGRMSATRQATNSSSSCPTRRPARLPSLLNGSVQPSADCHSSLVTNGCTARSAWESQLTQRTLQPPKSLSTAPTTRCTSPSA